MRIYDGTTRPSYFFRKSIFLEFSSELRAFAMGFFRRLQWNSQAKLKRLQNPMEFENNGILL